MSYGDVIRGRPSPVRPLLVGDIIDGNRVAGFAWKAGEGDAPSTHLDDRLLFDGDECLDEPAERAVPQTSEGALECAPVPPADLEDKHIRAAATVDPTIPYRVAALLDLPGAPWQPVARTLFASVHATGHRIWLAGGVVRDLVLEVPARQINDLDLAGTVPPGRFIDIAHQSLRASGLTEFRLSVTPNSLVCAITTSRPTKERLIEYRGLSVGGFRFPAVGSALAEDVRHRDFRFNALFYDLLDHELYDPSESGIGDLTGTREGDLPGTRKFVPLKETTDLLAQAEVVVRAMKFALRWRGNAKFELDGLNMWLARLAPDLCASLTGRQWKRLTRTYTRNVDADPADQRKFAAELIQPGRELLEKLIGGAP